MTQIIIPDILPLTQIVATVGQSVFSTAWTANFPTDVVVYYTPVGVSPDDVTQILDPSSYSVAFIGSDLIVQVTLVTPAINTGDLITITRQTPADRENLYSNTNFTPSMLNNDFGILTLVDQQAQLVNQQVAPRYNYSALVDVPIDTILPILAANEFWIKNGNNTAIVAAMLTGIITTWVTITAASFQAAAGNGIVTNNTTTGVQVTLPPTFNVGDVVEILGEGAGGWTLVANTGQQIKFGDVATSIAGAIMSDIPNANILVKGLVANSVWTVVITNSNPSYL
jgi:hypothetical protein